MSDPALFVDVVARREVARLAVHQSIAVERLVEILRRRRGALLADEPGLGKSYVGAAIAREYLARGDEVRFVVPASLVAQWREVSKKFEVEAAIITHESLPRMPIVAGAWRGLVVVDEAHHFRNRSTQRWRALARGLASADPLLITATPLCNRPSDIESLLVLFVEDDAFHDIGCASLEAMFAEDRGEIVRRVLDDCMVRRSRDVLPIELSFGDLTRRVVRYPAADRGIIGALSQLTFPVSDREQRPLLHSFLRDRLDSGIAALVESLRRQKKFYVRANEALRGGRRLTRADCRRLFGDADSEAFQDILFPSLWMPASSDGAALVPAIPAEMQKVDSLLALATNVEDPKAGVLLRLVDGLAASGDFRAILFTRSIATAFALEKRLHDRVACGVVTSRLARVRGMRCDRETVFDSFRRGAASLLIATDLAAEGLNLQEARYVIHYDMPWNPVRLDQRNGRAHRIGQWRTEVTAFHFVSSDRTERTLPFVMRKERARRTIVRTDDEVVDLRQLGAGVFHAASRGIAVLANERTFLFGDFVPVREHCEGHPLDTALRAELGARIAARSIAPPRLGTAQQKLANVLEKRRLTTADLLMLLSARYRAGIEMTIAEVADEYIDKMKLRELRDMLDRDAARRPADVIDLESATIVIGGSCRGG